MSFSLQILDDILIKKIDDLDNKISNFEVNFNTNIDYSRINKLDDRVKVLENQCRILSDLFNVCRNHTLDNKLIQTMLLDLTASIHNNSIEISLLKDRFNASTNPTETHNELYPGINLSNSNNREVGKWTKVKKKKKNRKKTY